MRDPNRIDPLLAKLGEAWKKYPDQRFGQFLGNFFALCDQDFFYPEDDAWLAALQAFIDGKHPRSAMGDSPLPWSEVEKMMEDDDVSDYQKFREEQMMNPEFRAYHMEMLPESDIAKAILAGRMQENLSQQELADTSKVSVAKINQFENCEGNPDLKTLKEIAKALGMKVKIEFVPASTESGDKAPD